MEAHQDFPSPRIDNQQEEGPECAARPGDTADRFPLVEGNTTKVGDDNRGGAFAGSNANMDLRLDVVAGVAEGLDIWTDEVETDIDSNTSGFWAKKVQAR